MKTLLIALTLTMLSACQTLSYQQVRNDPFIEANHQAADAIINSANSIGRDIQRDVPLLVATIVNIDALEESSRLGRIVSEQLQSRLAQWGYPVMELKLRGNLFIKQDQGELLLSRELQDITLRQKAQAVLVGTYALADQSVYINLKLVGINNVIIGAHDYALPLDKNVKALLNIPSVIEEPKDDWQNWNDW